MALIRIMWKTHTIAMYCKMIREMVGKIIRLCGIKMLDSCHCCSYER